MRAERRSRNGLHVLGLSHDDDQFLVVDQVFEAHFAGVVCDATHAWSCELGTHLFEFLLDDATQLRIALQNGLVLLDAGLDVGKFLLDVDARQASELAQLHVENVDGLALTEVVRLLHEQIFGRSSIFALSNERDDAVDDIESLQTPFEDVSTIACLVEAVLRATSDDFELMVDITGDCVGQVQRARHAVDERDHIHREAGLQLGELEQVVQHDIGVRIALQLDDEVGGATRRCIVHIGDAVELATIDQFLNSCGDRRTTCLIRQFGDANFHTPATTFFDGDGRARLHAAATCAVRVDDAGLTENETTGRKVGAVDELHEIVRCGLRVVDDVHGGVDDFTEVVRRN